MLRPVLLGAAVAGAVVVVLTGLLWAFQRSLVFLPDTGPQQPAAVALPGARDVQLETSDGLRLAGWHLPAPAPGSATVLVANGNGGHRGMRAPLAAALHDAGLGVLLFDYRGYAGNPGRPSEEGLARDVRAARDFLLGDAGVPESRLLYLGESLGAAVVTELAVEHPPAGLVLRSPFVDLPSVAAVHYPFLPVRALLQDRFPVAELVARVQAPTTVVYGTGDSIVPADQSRAVARAAGHLHRLVEVPGADHNDRVLLDGPEVVGAVAELAARPAD